MMEIHEKDFLNNNVKYGGYLFFILMVDDHNIIPQRLIELTLDTANAISRIERTYSKH